MTARILFNALAAVPAGGGVSRYAAELGRRLAMADERLRIVCTEDGAPLFESVPADRKTVWRVPSIPKGRLLLEEFRLPGLANSFDLLYQPDFKLPRGVRTPAIVTAHDLFFEDYPADYSFFQRRYKSRQARRAAARAVALVTLTRHVAEKVRIRYSLTAAPVVIPPGIDPADYLPRQPAALSVTSPFFLLLGSSLGRKNGQVALSAWAAGGFGAVPDSPPRLVWAGDHPAHAVNLPAGVEAVQSLPEAELKRHYATAAALLLPSIDEGFGLPALEAIAAGCPVLAGDLPVFRESFGAALNYVAAGIEGWREALAGAVQTPPQLDSKVRAAVLAQFNWPARLAAHLELMDRVLVSAQTTKPG